MGNSHIVNRINAILAEKGIAKSDFYKDCGITSASYSLWNTGKTTPRKKNLDVIAAYLGTSTDYLLTGLGEKEPIQESRRQLSDKDIKFALFGDTAEIDDADLEDVKRYAAFIAERKKAKKDGAS